MAKKKGTILDDTLIWVFSLAIALAIFYGLNHFVMGVQGLPLDWNLSPAN